MNYLVTDVLTSDDIEWLNNSTLPFDVINYRTGATLDDSDSGWCDWTTNARMISTDERIVFCDISEEELTLITLKFGNRLKELHGGARRIYNIQ